MSSEQQRIDELLQRYLLLVDEYSRLRENLASLQRGVFQDIARANFGAERGLRYGQDHYDERMKASKQVTIVESEGSKLPIFTVYNKKPQPETEKADATPSDDGVDHDESASTAASPRKKATNPLSWFGVLSPPQIRSAQSQSIQVIDDIIPRLTTIDAEMRHVEIEVRRARKRRAKAKNEV
ncbi:hypothetical protein VHEMI09432 [[Torrubiella] hemipterigena]|uniref:Vacuolar ATPase assembly protein VMA22 n=1 Tax=[Torrubiella] hemipterigena TaxID=1531966 RepID=A0A0A1TQ05_9HYPO|nr:hypothetical protein VHEMI09432 [[Torrubiella] hemipterigena]